jgi:hypothetical protein
MKAKVTVSNLWVGDKKYRRGDIVDVDDINSYGAKLELYVEPPKPKRKVSKKKVTKNAED